MQQKAPGVPHNNKLQLPQNNLQVRRGLSANFFKTTFSSRIKAVPAATTSSYSVEEVTKIGSAETKPVTRTRPRTAAEQESSVKVKVRRGLERTRSYVKKSDKSLDPERPTRSKPIAPVHAGPKTNENVKSKTNHDLKSPNVVLQIVKKSHAPKPPFPKEDSVLPPTLKPKVDESKLKLTKNINNNDVWTNAIEGRPFRKKVTSSSIRIHHQNIAQRPDKND